MDERKLIVDLSLVFGGIAMLVAFLIMLREGIEACLIVAIVASYLVKSGRARYLNAVWAGTGLAIALCIAIGLVLRYISAEFPQRQQELFECVVAVFAALILTSMVFWMKSAARSIKAQLHDKIDTSLAAPRGAALALVFMAFLAVGREGLETVVFLLAIFDQSIGWSVPIGAALGLFAAIAVGVLIFYGGVRLDLRRFFKISAVFIILVAAGLLAGAVRSLHEAGLWNGLQQIVADWSSALPKDGTLGTLLAGLFGYTDAPTLGEVLIYLAYLIPTLALFFAPTRLRATGPRLTSP
jgi:high-affinity iron transporter